MSSDGPLRVVLVSNYVADEQHSMQRFGDMLQHELTQEGVDVETWRPPAFVGGRAPAHGVGKWLGYIDKFVLYPPRLRNGARQHAGAPTVVHVCDHSNAIYVPWLRRIPHVVTCHDLIAVRTALGEFEGERTRWSGRRLQQMIRAGLRQADRIVCDSDATRRDVQRIVHPGEYAVIPPGLSPIFATVPPHEALERLASLRPDSLDLATWIRIASGPYLLHVGGNQWYKNRAGLIDIYRALLERMPNAPPLVIVGKPLPRVLADAVAASPLQGRVIALNGIGDRELAAVYSRAALLLFPSLAEGFGWPVLEAMACGCRVVTSCRPPMTEVAGDAATYLDPENPTSAAAVVEAALREPEDERRIRVREGLSRAGRFSSRATARAYLSVYQDAVNRRKNAA
jgi:glycosyltransferase involved in cell wall biosynthesis